jgi:hypothetical protein
MNPHSPHVLQRLSCRQQFFFSFFAILFSFLLLPAYGFAGMDQWQWAESNRQFLLFRGVSAHE